MTVWTGEGHSGGRWTRIKGEERRLGRGEKKRESLSCILGRYPYSRIGIVGLSFVARNLGDLKKRDCRMDGWKEVVILGFLNVTWFLKGEKDC